MKKNLCFVLGTLMLCGATLGFTYSFHIDSEIQSCLSIIKYNEMISDNVEEDISKTALAHERIEMIQLHLNTIAALKHHDPRLSKYEDDLHSFLFKEAVGVISGLTTTYNGYFGEPTYSKGGFSIDNLNIGTQKQYELLRKKIQTAEDYKNSFEELFILVLKKNKEVDDKIRTKKKEIQKKERRKKRLQIFCLLANSISVLLFSIRSIFDL